MTSGRWILALLVTGFFGRAAQAGTAPASAADTRNVSGWETGDAGQTVQPSPGGAGTVTGAGLQGGGKSSGGSGLIAAAGGLFVLGLFAVLAVGIRRPPVSRRNGHR